MDSLEYPDKEILHGSDAEAERVLKACFNDKKLEQLRDRLKARALLIQTRIDQIRGS